MVSFPLLHSISHWPPPSSEARREKSDHIVRSSEPTANPLSSHNRDLNPSHIGTTYEFTDCPRQSGFAVDGCKGCPDGSLCINVPYTYVGEYLFFSGALPYYYCIQNGNILSGDQVPS